MRRAPRLVSLHPARSNGPQDADKLEGGAFYLDRAPQVKHLRWAGTEYEDSAAAALVDSLLALAGLPASGTAADGGRG
jgi:hypothetical protein